MRSLFSVFDTDQSGFITQDNIKFAFQKLGQRVPDSVIKEVISKHDVKQNGVINFDEFKAIF